MAWQEVIGKSALSIGVIGLNVGAGIVSLIPGAATAGVATPVAYAALAVAY